VKDKLNSKLKLESMAEVYDYEDNYYVSKIWGFQGGDYEEWCLLGCYAVWLL
jgi:hypothetical protein